MVITALRKIRLRDVLLFSLVGFLAFAIWRGENGRAEALAENRATIEQVARTNQRQRETIRALCDRGYILDGLVEAAIQLVRQPPNPPEDLAFIREFTSYHLQLLDQLTNPESPCVKSY